MPARWTSWPSPPCDGSEDDEAAEAPAKPMVCDEGTETELDPLDNPCASSNWAFRSVSDTGTPLKDKSWLCTQNFCLRLSFARLQAVKARDKRTPSESFRDV